MTPSPRRQLALAAACFTVMLATLFAAGHPPADYQRTVRLEVVPECPTEDSCRATWDGTRWEIEETTP